MIPTVALAIVLLQLDWLGSTALVLAVLAPAVWGTFLSYSAGEHLVRPLVSELAAALPDEFPFARAGLPVIPAQGIAAGVHDHLGHGHRGGRERYARSVRADRQRTGRPAPSAASWPPSWPCCCAGRSSRRWNGWGEGMRAVRSGDYTARVPVMSSDEIGELSHDFNRMAHGLAQREEMREAFATYVDRSMVELILSGRFPPEGVEVDVSILFTDVQGFTSYAETASAREVIGTLNEQFELMVPIIERHGGHVDKFIGDGMMAVFGAPEFFPTTPTGPSTRRSR